MTNKPIRILIVDDEPDMLWTLSQSLGYAGYAVTQALNAHEALNYVRQGSFALALIDVKLPDMDGLQLATMVKAIAPNLAIILISGYYYVEDSEIAREVNQNVATSFLSKPFSLQEIRNTIQRVLATNPAS